MNELTRYEHEAAKQLSDLPVPDENMAWEEMAKLLDDDKPDRPVVPVWLKSGCLLWGLVFLLVSLTAGWYFFVNKNKQDIAEQEKTTQSITPQVVKNVGKDKRVGVTVSDTVNADDSLKKIDSVTENTNHHDQISNASAAKSHVSITNSVASNDEDSKIRTHTKGSREQKFAKKRKPQRKNGRHKIKVSAPGTDEDNDLSMYALKKDVDSLSIAKSTAIADTSGDLKKKENKADTIKKIVPDTSIATKTPDKPSKKYFFNLGIAVFQPFAINGESAVPYSRNGRKGSLTDYIPSLYLRFNREKKWFLQSEFRFGVPQFSRSYTYRTEKIDTVTLASYQLKKTYYHQVPVSFNYYILPGLSIGTGIMYSRFSTAVSEERITRDVGAAADSLISTGIIRDRTDSNFTKHNFQWLAEVQYQWKRFSFGARLSQDLKPFIRYTDQVSGTPVSKKNMAFNVFVRYELWRSKK